MKIGIIGLGSIGLRHARNAKALGADVIAFDPDADRRSLAQAIGAEVTDNEDHAFDAADAVVVCSPNKFHLDHLRRAVSAGKHALVEKPLSHTMDGIYGVLDNARAKNLVVGVAMNLRFHPVSQAVKAIIESAEFGAPLWARFTMSSYLPDWRPHQDYRKGYTADVATGGVLLDVIHEPDLAQFLLGPAEVITASAYNTGLLDIPTEDCADIVLNHGTMRSSIHMDYVSQYKRRFFEIQCANAFLHGDLNGRILKIIDNSGALIRDEKFTGSYDDDYIQEMKNFMDAVAGTAEYKCPADKACGVLEGIMTARKIAGIAGA